MNCLLASDHWDDAVVTYRRNMPDHQVINTDIRDLTVARLRKLLPAKPDWIVGGPPCQGYSTVGRRNRSDPRNVLFMEFRRLVAGIKPKGFVIENVLGLKDMSYEHEVAESFKELGYRVRFMVLTSAEYGVPSFADAWCSLVTRIAGCSRDRQSPTKKTLTSAWLMPSSTYRNSAQGEHRRVRGRPRRRTKN